LEGNWRENVKNGRGAMEEVMAKEVEEVEEEEEEGIIMT